MARKFGTRYFGSLNTKVGANNLDDVELQVCTNVRRDVAGQLSPARESSLIYSPSASDAGLARGMAALVMSGTTTLAYATDNNVYVDGTAIGTAGGEVTHRFLGDGTRAYVLNGVENKVWDGTNYRDHGPPPDPSGFWKTLGSSADSVVLAVTPGASTTTIQLSPTGGDHGMATGDWLRITSMTGGTWSTINGTYYRVTVTEGDTESVAIDLDSSGLGTWSGGLYRKWPSNIDYAVQIRVTFVVTLPSGQEIETNPVLFPYTTLNGDTAAQTPAGEDQLFAVVTKMTSAELAAYVGDTDGVTVDARMYRNKSGGSDFYLCGTASAGPGTGSATVYDKSGGDSYVGAAWLDDYTDHSAPTQCTLGVFCQQRLFLAGDTSYPSRLYYSMIGKYDYFPPLNYIECIDTITGLSRFGEHVLIATASGFKLFSPVGTVGQMTDAQSPVGCEHPDSFCITEFGTIFCRADGAWLFNGVTANKISEKIDSLWKAASGTWRGAYIANHGYFTCGNGGGAKAFEFWKSGDKIEWSVAPDGYSDSSLGSVDSPYIAVSGAPDDTYIYGMAEDGTVCKLQGATTLHSMAATTKAFGDGSLRRWVCVRADLDTGIDITLTVTTNRGQSENITIAAPVSAPVRYDLSVSMLGEDCEVSLTGKPTAVRSIILEAT